MFDFRSKKEIKEWKCVDCKVDTILDDKNYYMVTKDIWNKYGVKKKMLCIDCLENRIGRKLQKNDILNCYLSYSNPYTRNLINK